LLSPDITSHLDVTGMIYALVMISAISFIYCANVTFGMTTADKFGMAFAIGFTVALVAVAMAFAGMETTPTPVTPTERPVAPTTPTQPTTPTKATIPGYDRLTSIQDPGLGHESHQLAVILPPSDKVYSGTLQYDASEPVQLVVLTGPLAPGEDRGQPIWTPDGQTKFALTLVDPKNARGEWKFAGNALAVHTMKTTPFIVDYKVNYETKSPSETVKTGTIQSMQDPGLGHESHQLAVILPPSDSMYSGILAYSASEPIQLVSLKGPLAPGQTAPATWTPDGTTIFELTLVDPNSAMGTWEFSGNALAVHTMKTTPFTASYTVSATATASAPPKETAPEPVQKPMSATVSLPSGSSLPGCETTNECFIPATVTIGVGGTVTWTNDDTAAHTVTSGTVSNGPDGKFDSSIFMARGTFSHTFSEAGQYDYFCIVHPWMTGKVIVE
jgi:plastocyanin